MKNPKTAVKRTIVMLIAIVMLMTSGGIPAVMAAGEYFSKSDLVDSVEEVQKLLTSDTYSSYRALYESRPRATKEIVIDASQFVEDEELTDANVYLVDNYQGAQGKTLIADDTGKVTWKFNVEESGLYAIKVEYYTVVNYKVDDNTSIKSKTSSIERMLLIDNKVLFTEARSVEFSKVFADEYVLEDGTVIRSDSEEFLKLITENPDIRLFEYDNLNNEMKNDKVEVNEWRTEPVVDSSSFYNRPFEFYLEKGEHSIALDAIREPIAIKSITLYPLTETLTYEEYLKLHSDKNDVKDVSPIIVQGEYPYRMSDNTIYSLNDRTSSVTMPSHSSRIRYNTIGGEKWQYAGSWISWKVDIPESGFYNIIPRAIQSYYSGVYVSREFAIDGVVPFEEASYLRFNFSDKFTTNPINNGEQEFKIYLEKGIHEISFKVVLGDMAEMLAEIQNSITSINAYRRKLLMVTGPDPDEYRDYGFEKSMPDVLKGLKAESEKLYGISKKLIEIIGQPGDHSVLLDKVAFVLERMADYPTKIASLMDDLRDQSGSLGTWLMQTQNQPLLIDYIAIQPVDAPKPKADAGFFASVWHEIVAFVQSFFADYNTIGGKDGDEKIDESRTIDVWVASGRDQAQIIKSLVDDFFTPEYNVAVNLRLVVAGTLLPATLAGTGPDVSLSTASSDAINYAIRSAVLKLNEHDTFDEVMSRFAPAAKIPVTLYGDTYGIPENMSFPMLFYRKDILAELNIEVPETWDDFMDAIYKIQANKLDIGFPTGVGGSTILMYQQGEPMYDGALIGEDGKEIPNTAGMTINLDSNIALGTFKEVCELFTQYDFPVTYDMANRFRSGEMPMVVADYSAYNQLVIFAPEIKGMWAFTTLPGYAQEDGTINNTTVGTVSCAVMMRNATEEKREFAWDFMDWWTTANTQSSYANEMEAIIGPSAKQPTANLEALYNMAWSADEYKNLYAQFQQVECTPEFPGSYIIGRYTNFAFLNVYNDGAEPVEALRDYIDDINKELTRKRKEFDLPTADDFKEKN